MPQVVEADVRQSIDLEQMLELSVHILARHRLPDRIGKDQVVLFLEVLVQAFLLLLLFSMLCQAVQDPLPQLDLPTTRLCLGRN